MLGLFFIKTCLTALAKNALVSDSNFQLQYSCSARYIYSDEKQVRFIFYKVINDDVKKEIIKQPLKSTVTKEGGAVEYIIELESLKKWKNQVNISDGINEEFGTYPFISEKITISVDGTRMKELLKRGEVIKINLGIDKNFNYFRIPIFIRPFSSNVSSYEADFNNGAFGYTVFFEDLIEKHIIKLSDEDKKKCIKELNNLLTLSTTKLGNTYKGKLFLLLKENLSILKPVICCFKDLIEIEKNPKNYLEKTVSEIGYIWCSINLGKFMPTLEGKRGVFSSCKKDSRFIAITHGIVTDILNICRFAVDNSVKFDIYEIFDHCQKLSFSCRLDIRIKMEDYDSKKVNSVDVRSNLQTRLPFDREDLDDGFIVKLTFTPNSYRNVILAICIDVEYSSMSFTTGFINLQSAING
ncbi:hypothetical protein NCER_101610 [Vairimorpha ceranae BRL01]|uniref:Uncharacterized protein n=1 Tax=Vairimorpha ceranae (strain BRL01) TaxID=578460 RepID=C4VAE4_VAIC1|nr:hypothetical protein NCER_101610 [Vairimorpha ceranae BRL01]